MIIVSDTSIIANLLVIQRLDILRAVFFEVLIPPAVNAEVMALEGIGTDLSKYKSADWIKVVSPKNELKVATLREVLDEGESQAIALALEIHCELLLIDERLGTKVAKNEGLSTLGLIGLLILAKKRNLISAVKPFLVELKEKAGFWLGVSLVEQILKDEGEL